MAEETCESILPDQQVCGAPAIPCLRCSKAFCQRCSEAHNKQDHHFPRPAVIIVRDAVRQGPLPLVDIPEIPARSQEPEKPAESSPFDPLFVDKPPSGKPLDLAPEELEKPEEPITEEQIGEMFSSEINRVVFALDLLVKRGLNQAAVVALIHDADSKIPKSTILKVLKTLRQLPDLYGRKRPGRKI